MKMNNLLHFTEHHRFYVFRDYTLGSLDDNMLHNIYQPMVGAFATSLYQWLYRQVPSDQTGYSAVEPQRAMFLSIDCEPGERGRKFLIEQTSKLEAVGLLQTSRVYVPSLDEYIFEYHLLSPLLPNEFFNTSHLMMLFRDKVGKHAVMQYRQRLYSPEPEWLADAEKNRENLSVPFYELFRLNANVIDFELERALEEVAPAKPADLPDQSLKYRYEDIITRFPRQSANRPHVEAIRTNAGMLEEINYIAGKYSLSLGDTCRLLDEDGVFGQPGELVSDVLKYRANELFRQGKKRDDDRERYLRLAEKAAQPEDEPGPDSEQPVQIEYYLEVPERLTTQCDIHQYNFFMRNEPYTKVIKRFFPNNVPNNVLNVLQTLDLNYHLKEEVINVFIHYNMTSKKSSWGKNYTDTVASNLMTRNVGSYEEAVQFFRDWKAAAESRGQTGQAASKSWPGSGAARSRSKPKIPVVTVGDQTEPVSEQEVRDMLAIAKKLKK